MIDFSLWFIIGLKIYALVTFSNFLIVLGVLLIQRKIKR